MEAFETEEQQVEALQKWWKENGTASLIGLGIGLVAILGWNYWLDYKKVETGKASAMYDQLLKNVNENQKDAIDTVANKLKTEFKSTEYAAYSTLLQAKSKIDGGDLAGAKELLQSLANQSGDLSQLAQLRLVRLYLATGEYEKGLQLINAVDPKTTESLDISLFNTAKIYPMFSSLPPTVSISRVYSGIGCPRYSSSSSLGACFVNT